MNLLSNPSVEFANAKSSSASARDVKAVTENNSVAEQIKELDALVYAVNMSYLKIKYCSKIMSAIYLMFMTGATAFVVGLHYFLSTKKVIAGIQNTASNELGNYTGLGEWNETISCENELHDYYRKFNYQNELQLIAGLNATLIALCKLSYDAFQATFAAFAWSCYGGIVVGGAFGAASLLTLAFVFFNSGFYGGSLQSDKISAENRSRILNIFKDQGYTLSGNESLFSVKKELISIRKSLAGNKSSLFHCCERESVEHRDAAEYRLMA